MAAGRLEPHAVPRRERWSEECRTTSIDNAPDALGDANREDKAKSGAAVGMAAAGSRNRQDRRQDRQGEDAWQKSYDACLQSAPK